MSTTRKVLTEFIEIYKSHPCLWKIASKEYHIRDKKEAAYRLLVEKLREIEGDADKGAVVRKINNLRSCFRKERIKHEQSLIHASSADDVYRSKLWYYDLLTFLNDRTKPGVSWANIDSEEEDNFESVKTDESLTADERSQNLLYSENINVTPIVETNSTFDNVISPKLQSVHSAITSSSRPPKRPLTDKIDPNLSNEVLESIRDHFKRPRLVESEDRCDVIGKNVAFKLKILDYKQMIIAEKLINDLLFEAEMGNLTADHASVNMRDVLKQHLQE